MPAARPVFVDTNVLVYSLDSLHPEKRERAKRWLDLLWAQGNGRLSWQVIHEFYANAERKARVARQVARRAVEFFLLWNPIQNSAGLVRRSWEWVDTAQISYWDGLILAAAETADCAWLLSEDFQAGRTYGSVTIVNPFQQDPSDSRLIQ